MKMITGHRRRRLTQPNMETCSIENLPDELIQLILLKCDVKSVIRFKSVSKSWQAIISHPRFMETLQNKLRSKNHNKFFCWIDDKEVIDNRLYLVSLEQGGKFRREEVLGYPSPKLVPVSYCNGLILLGKSSAEYVLWNPLIKKHITIPTFVHPLIYIDWYYHDYHKDHHFFYDSVTLDYKIVFVYLPCFYTVYSCKNRSWTEIKDFPKNIKDLYIIVAAELWINGCLYTLSITKEDEKEQEARITYFDARDGKMHILGVPSEVMKDKYPLLEMEGVSGRLCVYFFDEDENSLKLWVMEEGSDGSKRWKKVISMEIADPQLLDDLAPTCLSDGDDFVLWAEVPLYDGDGIRKNKYPRHFIYHHHRGNCSFKETDFTWDYCRKYFPYKESLYMPQ